MAGVEKRRNANPSCSGASSVGESVLGAFVLGEGWVLEDEIGRSIGPYKAARRDCSADSSAGSASGSGDEDGARSLRRTLRGLLALSRS